MKVTLPDNKVHFERLSDVEDGIYITGDGRVAIKDSSCAILIDRRGHPGIQGRRRSV